MAPTIIASSHNVDFKMNPFEQVPGEILLDIMSLVADLPSLYSFVKASRAVKHLYISEYGTRVTESVMRTSLPPQIQNIIRIVVLIRSSSLPCHNLDEFVQKYISEEASCIPYSMSNATSPEILYGILTLARQIWCLTHSCLQHYINRSMSIQPSHLADKTFTYRGNPNSRVPSWRQRPEGRRYQPKNAGPPSWVEEQRITRAFWLVQLFYDVKNSASRINWPERDINRLKTMEAADLGDYQRFEQEQIKTAVDYINEIDENADLSPTVTEGKVSLSKLVAENLRLPWPTQQVEIDWLTLEYTSDVRDHPKLERAPPGYTIATWILRNHISSPLRYITFEPFRRFGFAIFDEERMRGLELMTPEGPLSSEHVIGDLLFTWRSILSDDELEKFDKIADELHERETTG